MADGSERPIEAVRVGDLVAAFDEFADGGRGPLKAGRVTRLFENVTDHFLIAEPSAPGAAMAARDGVAEAGAAVSGVGKTGVAKIGVAKIGVAKTGVAMTGGHGVIGADGLWRTAREAATVGVPLLDAAGGPVQVTWRRVDYSNETAERYERASQITTATLGGLALKPQVEEGWKTYNFEVEGLHTYVAGRLRVHNESVLDYVPLDAVVIGLGGPQASPDKAVYLRGDEQVYVEMRLDAQGRKQLYQEVRLLDAAPNPWVRPDGSIDPDAPAWGPGNGAPLFNGGATLMALTDVRSTDGFGEPIDPTSFADVETADIQSVEVNGAVMLAGNIGASLGASLGRAIAGDNKVAQFAASTFMSALGRTMVEAMSGDLNRMVLDRSGAQSIFDLGVERAFDARLGQNLSDNLLPSAASALSAVLMGELAEALGLKGFEGRLFTTAGVTITSQFLTNVTNVTLQTPGASLFAGFNVANMATQLGGAIAGLLGSELGNSIVKPHGPQSALFGSALGSIGAIGGVGLTTGTAIGASLTAVTWGIPIIGPFVGALLGTVLGNWIGNQIAGNSASLHELVYDPATETFRWQGLRDSNGPNVDLRNAMMSTAENSIRSLLHETGGKFDPASGMFRIGFGHFADKYMAFDVAQSSPYPTPQHPDNPGTYEIAVPGQLGAQAAFSNVVDHGVSRTLANSNVVGGDIVVQRAFYAWQALAKTENGWTYHSAAHDPRAPLSQLSFDLKIAKDFRYYLENTQLVNKLIDADIRIERGETVVGEFASTWLATLSRASELGLADASKFDFIGGMVQSLATRGMVERAIAATPDFDGADLLLIDPDTGAISSGLADFFGPGRTHKVVGGALTDLIDLADAARQLEGARAADYAIAAKEGLLGGVAGTALPTITQARFDELFLNPLYTVIRAEGGDGADILRGTSGTDMLVGGAGGDNLEGRGGQDWLAGDSGADALNGGDGDDFLSGGAGDDTVFGADGTDFVAGGDGADTLVGGLGADVLAGGAGGDLYRIYPNDSDKVLNAIGNRNGDVDVVQFNVDPQDSVYDATRRGYDLVASVGRQESHHEGSSYFVPAARVVVEDFFGRGLIDRFDTTSGQSWTALQFLAQLSYLDASGSAASELFNNADATNAIFTGGGGRDVVIAGPGRGHDTFRAGTPVAMGSGAESNQPLIANDISRDRVVVLDGASVRTAMMILWNKVIIAFDSGNSMTVERGAELSSNSRDSQVEIVFQDGSAVATFAPNGALVSVIMRDDETWSRANVMANADDNVVAGTDGVDLLVGGTGNDLLQGLAGRDRLEGGAGNDTLVGGAGMDVLDGGEGYDWVRYDNATRGVTMSLASMSSPRTAALGDATGDSFLSIEAIVGSRHADELSGDAVANAIIGHGGDDALSGAAGVDTLVGGHGDDVLDGGAGSDSLDGGEGVDLASYATSVSAVVASLFSPSQNTGDAAGDLYVGLEGLQGSASDDALLGDNANNRILGGRGADKLYGMGGADRLDGEIGDDTLFGHDQNDTLSGGAGDDVLTGENGADRLDGGEGSDWASYETDGAGIELTLGGGGTGSAAGDLFVSIENLKGSSFNDTLVGDDGSNMLSGGPGADVLNGGNGEDVAFYGWAAGTVRADLLYPSTNVGEATGDTHHSIENLWGSAFADTLAGDGASNTLLGQAGADVIDGRDGNDLIEGGAGADGINGGDGYDYAVHAKSMVAVRADLTTPSLNSGDAAGDVYVSIEGLVGGAFDDTLSGDGAQNVLRGGFGDDRLFGGGGGDTLEGAEGDDWLDGGAGADRLDGGGGESTVAGAGGFDYVVYDSALAPVHVDLHNSVLNTGDAAGDVYFKIDGVIGTSFADTLSGNGAADALYGMTGSDLLSGLGGSDTLVGGAGADTLNGGADSDYLLGGDGADVLNGEDGADNLSGGAGADLLFGHAGVDTLIGEAGADTLEGGADADHLLGGDDADVLNGGDGDDHLTGGAGADHLIGGDAGLDVARYDDAAAAFRADLLIATSNTGAAAGDTYLGIEGLSGGIYGDTLCGDEGSNRLYGFDGDDWLYGRGGGDSLLGAGGDDHLEGGAQPDTMDGGEGFDFVRYDFAGGAVLVDLTYGALNLGDAHQDEFTSVEAVIGSSHGDTLRGTSGYNWLIGGLGADRLEGREGDDDLDGGAGADIIDGGAGVDVARYDFAGAGLRVDLANQSANLGDATGDQLISIEGLKGGAHGDTLSGDAGANELIGQGGADTLHGRDGADTLDGGVGDDHLLGGHGADRLTGGDGFDFARYDDALTAVRVDLLTLAGNSGDAAGDVFNSIEGLVGGAFADSLLAAAGANIIYALAGDDNLEGGADADHLDGGSGFDVVWYNRASTGVIVDLQVASGNTGEAAGDVFVSIEGVVGSGHDDALLGDDAVNALHGVGGADWLHGRGGSDYLDGGDGADNLNGGSGADTLMGGAGLDFARYDHSTTGVTVEFLAPASNTGEAAGDVFGSIEGLVGGAHGDSLRGDDGANILYGLVGSDWLYGRGGADTLIGDVGDDHIDGGASGDLIDGGEGMDFSRYDFAGSGVRADLLAPANNVGEAAGDQFVSIEGLVGGAFNDTLSGDGAANQLYGGAGDDTIEARGGADYLHGGAGGDTFRFAIGFGHDTIADFAAGAGSTDALELSLGSPFDTFAEVLAAITQEGSDAVFRFDTANTIVLQNVLKSALLAEDVRFF